MRHKLTIGNLAEVLYILQDEEIGKVEYNLALDVIGDKLAIDTLTASVENTAEAQTLESVLTSNGQTIILAGNQKLIMSAYTRDTVDFATLQTGTPIKYYFDNTIQGKFYLEAPKRTGKTSYEITAVSAVGLLDNIDHTGGIYTGETFANVFAAIWQNVAEYSINAAVAAELVYGFLPYQNARNNLHMLLTAFGAAIKKDANGEVLVDYLTNDSIVTVPDNRIFIGGSIAYNKRPSEVSVTEHEFLSLTGDEEITLFDNTSGAAASNTLIKFPDPMHDLTTSGTLTIIISHVNYAVVSGQGTLTGKAYTHVERIVSRSMNADSAITAATAATAKLESNTLINTLNSAGVLERLAAYYGSAKKITTDIVLDGEKTGTLIALSDPYGERASGFISKLAVRASSFLRASSEIISGYIPRNGGNTYKSVTVKTSGSFTLPATATNVKLVIIGGGAGGWTGQNGFDGEAAETQADFGEGGAGGEPGIGGAGGKVLIVMLQNVGGKTLTIIAGSGGTSATPIAGSGAASLPGGNGGNTTCTINGTTYSSAAGEQQPYGYTDPLSGIVYAAPGKADGIKGGRGGKNNALKTGYEAENIELNGTLYRGGTTLSIFRNTTAVRQATGAGSGAAAGKNGIDGGTDPAEDADRYGRDGVQPVARSAASNIGTGGDGGHGGSGGGCGGSSYNKIAETYYFYPGGAGGKGGRGGRGAAGGVIIYY